MYLISFMLSLKLSVFLNISEYITKISYKVGMHSIVGAAFYIFIPAFGVFISVPNNFSVCIFCPEPDFSLISWVRRKNLC